LRIERGAPLCFHNIDLRAAALRHIDHARAEHAVHADEHGVARLDQIDKTGLHTRAAGAGHRQRQAILGLKHLAQHGHALIHNLQKLGIQVADHGKR
jgi:hypothetical protein